MPVRKSVVALQVFLILGALLCFYRYYVAVETTTPSDVAKGPGPEYVLFWGIVFIAGCVILLLFVTYDAPYRGAPASVQGRQRISAPSL